MRNNKKMETKSTKVYVGEREEEDTQSWKERQYII
jgi:hypothetical protein